MARRSPRYKTRSEPRDPVLVVRRHDAIEFSLEQGAEYFLLVVHNARPDLASKPVSWSRFASAVARRFDSSIVSPADAPRCVARRSRACRGAPSRGLHGPRQAPRRSLTASSARVTPMDYCTTRHARLWPSTPDRLHAAACREVRSRTPSAEPAIDPFIACQGRHRVQPVSPPGPRHSAHHVAEGIHAGYPPTPESSGLPVGLLGSGSRRSPQRGGNR